jgi:hypothetical protein
MHTRDEMVGCGQTQPRGELAVPPSGWILTKAYTSASLPLFARGSYPQVVGRNQ